MRLVFRTIHGSHLYGTNTPDSDTDIKGVYIAPLKDVCLRRVEDTIRVNTKEDKQAKNTSSDIDIVHKELFTFLRDCMAGDLYAIDLLLSPPQFWMEIDGWEEYIWEDILQNRSKLLSSSIHSYINYCKKHAGKYGLKGSRLGEVHRLKSWLDGLPNRGAKVSEVIEDFQMSESIFITKRTRGNQEKPAVFLQVLEKFYQVNMKADMLSVLLSTWIEQYGDKSKSAAESGGIEWKAVSHAFRSMLQVNELFSTGEIVFPLKKAEYLKKIKAGEIEYARVQDELAGMMEEITSMKSVLPDELDREFWDSKIYDYYLGRLD